MPAPSLRDAILSAFTRLSADDLSALEDLRPLYAGDVTFEDPVQKVEGVEAFLDVNRRLARKARELSFAIERVAGDDAEFFITWHMRLRPKLGPLFELDGVSHLRAEGGKVRYHRDYWDLAALFASAVPGGQRILRALLKPLA
jgi:limonene-1,2-epoxide hydrolase